MSFAGEPTASKRKRLAKVLMNNGAMNAFIALPDSICWLLNIRAVTLRAILSFTASAVLKASGDIVLFTDAVIDENVLAILAVASKFCPLCSSIIT